MTRTIVLAAAALMLLSGCVTQNKYDWGTYDTSLYGYYKDPEQLEELMQALEQTIDDSTAASTQQASATDGSPRKIAPGLYAEYGYLLMLTNRRGEARKYFLMEKETWPESTVLMDKMIAVVDSGPNSKSRIGITEAGNTAK